MLNYVYIVCLSIEINMFKLSTVKKYWSLLLLKSRGDSKRELGIKFNSPYFIANVSLIRVRAHVYERYVNFASYCTAKKCTFIKLAKM